MYLVGKFKKIAIVFLKKIRQKSKSKENIKFITKVNVTMLADSLFLFGNTIAASYLKAEIIDNTAKRFKKIVIEPKSSTEYILLKKGCNANGITCAIMAPITNVNVFLESSDNLSIKFFNKMYSKSCLKFLEINH